MCVIFFELLKTVSDKLLPDAKDAPMNLDGFTPLLVVDAGGSASAIKLLVVAAVLTFLLQDVVEEDPHRCLVPKESDFLSPSSYIYGTVSTQNLT